MKFIRLYYLLDFILWSSLCCRVRKCSFMQHIAVESNCGFSIWVILFTRQCFSIKHVVSGVKRKWLLGIISKLERASNNTIQSHWYASLMSVESLQRLCMIMSDNYRFYFLLNTTHWVENPLLCVISPRVVSSPYSAIAVAIKTKTVKTPFNKKLSAILLRCWF